MYEEALRKKLRFATPLGGLTLEDLWDLPLTTIKDRTANLDDIARSLHRQLKNDEDVSFVEVERKSDSTKQLMFDIVKHIIDVKLAENKQALEAAERHQRKQRLLGILADREDANLRSLPIDEIRKQLQAL